MELYVEKALRAQIMFPNWQNLVYAQTWRQSHKAL